MPGIKVTKGMIVVPNASRETVRFKEFMFNPPELSDSKSVNYGTLDVPGGSHPTYQYGSGGARVFTFELYLDGDRGRSGLRQKGGDGLTLLPDIVGLSVKQEIAWYRSLLYPTAYSSGSFESVSPRTVLFSLGNYLRSVPCKVTQADVKITFWTPYMEPVRANVAMTLEEQITRNQTSETVLREANVGKYQVGF